jgi:arsenate-mycothiol transferase
MTDAVSKPSVLFVCVKNAGKSQMAAGLMSKIAGETVDVYSAGTKPGAAVNDLSAEALAEVGVDISEQTPNSLIRNWSRWSTSWSSSGERPESIR